MRLLKEAHKENLHDYWRVYWKAREKGERQPYIVAEIDHADFIFGRSRYVLLGYLRPDGLIELEPFNESDREDWRNFIEALFDYGGNVYEFCKLPSNEW